MVPVEWLAHHPDNPRKDLGDLTELAESIRANGILQNLTIVPVEDDGEHNSVAGMYWVVIGNRRFEAAMMAGLNELPCVVSDMDHKTQVATMLQENMQRADLTVYEQAEGFQMMMDLGFKPKEISEKTGFSEKTVKDRLKLTKLNKKGFSAAVNRGATLLDLIEVTKLDSKADQNKVLEYAGTDNFRKEMMDALQEQEFQKDRKRLEPICKEFMEELPSNERYNNKWERAWSNDFKMTGTEEELRKHIEKVMKQHKDVPWRYCIWKYNNGGDIEFFHGQPKKESAPLAEGELSERAKAIRRGKHLRYVKSFWAQAYELRKDFVKNYTVANGASASTIGKILIRYALNKPCEWDGKLQKNHDWNDAYIREVLGLPEKPVESGRKDPEREWHTDYFTIWEQVDGKIDIPLVRVMLAWAVAGGVFWPDDPERGLYKYDDGSYENPSNRDSDMTRLYAFLQEIGYGLSDMEKQLLDGTHPCYQEDAGV
jgi:ParB family chromosome partitioning protein